MRWERNMQDEQQNITELTKKVREFLSDTGAPSQGAGPSNQWKEMCGSPACSVMIVIQGLEDKGLFNACYYIYLAGLAQSV
jgi:hypothetical protein